MIKNSLILIIVSLLLLSFVSANSYLNIHVRPLTTGVYQPNTQFNYTFNFTTTNSCTGVLLSRNAVINTDGYGIGYANIDITNLNGTPTYLCEYKNNILRKTHLLGSGLFYDLHVTNNLKVGGNVTADHFIGDGSLLTGISTSDSHWIIDDYYLNNVSNVLTFNESLLNLTIDARDTTYSLLSEFINDVGYVTNISVNKSQDCSLITGSVSNLCTLTDTDTNTDSHWIIDDYYLNNVSNVLTFNESLLNNTIDDRDDDTTYSAGDGITLSGTTISITSNSITDTQLAYNTGQHLTTTSNPNFAGVNISGYNVTDVDCIIFTNGGKICSGN